MNDWRIKLKQVAGPKIASVVPVAAWHALAGRPVLLPYYHMVSDELVPHLRHLYPYKNVAQFKADLDFFLGHCQPVSLEDLLACLYRGRSLPKRSFLFSFDDGFREMAEIVAPILNAKGVPAVFFVNSAFVDNRELCFHHKISLLLGWLLSNPDETRLKKFSDVMAEPDASVAGLAARLRNTSYAERRTLDHLAAACDLNFEQFLAQQRPYLSSQQIRGLLRDGFSIGAHSVDHPFYGALTLDEQLRQTRDSMRFLHEQFRVRQKAFAFPHSDAGVSRAFFEQISRECLVDISFGTAGLLPGEHPAHFQRFAMEKSENSARQILAWQSARCGYRTFINRNGSSQTPALNQALCAPTASLTSG
jgi:peptidoglycan/xylan/chitin deacetylase (PgdA/CDA1 family)